MTAIFHQTRYEPSTGLISGYPLSGSVTSYWGAVDAPEHARGHSGVDIGVAHGTAVLAPAPGITKSVITKDSGWDAWYATFGNSVVLEHDGGWFTLYAHLDRPLTVPGKYVQLGTGLGYSGGTPGTDGAGTSTGPHLHWGLSRDPLFARAQTLDPLAYLGVTPLPGGEFLPEPDIDIVPAALWRALYSPGISTDVRVTNLPADPGWDAWRVEVRER